MGMDSLADIDASAHLDGHAIGRVLAFLESAALSGPAWADFKRLVRQLESGVQHGVNEILLGTALRQIDEEPFSRSNRAFWPALGYWKRRGRRFLRKLARESSLQHDTIAKTLLGTVCTGSESLPEHAWISLDLLFGKPRDTSGKGFARRRLEQLRHGRGPVRMLHGPPARRTVLEDRLLAADPEFTPWLESIVKEASRPWEVLEMAVRRLRHLNADVPTSMNFIVRAAKSGSHLLRQVAAAKASSGESVRGDAKDGRDVVIDPESDVQLLVGVGSRSRNRLEPGFLSRANAARASYVAAIFEQTRDTLFLDSLPKPVRFLISLLSGSLRDALPDDLSTRARDLFATDLAFLLTVPGGSPVLLGRIRHDCGSASRAVIQEHLERLAIPGNLAARWMFRGRLSSESPSLDELRSRAALILRRAQVNEKQQAKLMQAAVGSEQGRRKALALVQGGLHLQAATLDARSRAEKDESIANMLRLYDRANVSLRAGQEAHAASLLRHALETDTLHGWLPHRLAWLLGATGLAKHRNPTEAVTLAWAACTASDWRVGAHWDALSAAFAASGRFAEAVVAAEAAIHLDPTLSTVAGTAVVDSLRLGRLHPRDKLFTQPDGQPCLDSKTLVPVRHGSKFGYARVDDPGRPAIPPRFDDAQPFCDGLAHVRVAGRQGVVDETGRFVVDPLYERIGAFIDGLAVAVTDSGEVLVDARGRIHARPVRARFVGFLPGGSGGDLDILVESGAIDSPAFAGVSMPPPASEVGFAAMHSCRASECAAWLDAVCLAPASYRERALSILESHTAGIEFDATEILAMVSHGSAWVRNAGWRLVRRSATDTAVLESVWQQIADRGCDWHLDSDEAMALIEESADVAEVAAGLFAGNPPALLAGLADASDARRRLASIALHRMRNTSFRRLIDVAGGLDEDAREHALDAIEASLRGRALGWNRVRALVVNSTEAIRMRGWRLAASTERSHTFASAAAASVGSWKPGSVAWSTARESGDAIDLLMEGGLAANSVEKAAAVVESCKDESRAGLLRLDTLVRLAGIDEAAWHALRGELLRRSNAGGEGFWRTCLEGGPAAGVAGRMAADTAFLDEFSSIGDAWPARLTAPSAAPLVKAWMERHGEVVADDSSVLVTLAGSVEPSVRSMALGMLDRGFVAPVTLSRLVETGHPECESLAHRLLDRYDTPSLVDALLLLWDSPAAAGRTLALKMLGVGRIAIDHELLGRLTETRDPTLLAGLATFMDEHAPSGELRRRYDATVLRVPWLGRPAKEAVKRRAARPGAEPIDLATLSALAESPVAADREWAIAKLVEAAARGETAAGLTIVKESSS